MAETGTWRCVVYRSSAADLWSDSDLAGLVGRAQASNGLHGITGLLVYRHRQFVQLLEGPAPAVEALLGRIERDPRHCELIVLLRRDVPSRAFADWALAAMDDRGVAACADVATAIDAIHAVAMQVRSDLDEIIQSPVPPGEARLRHPTQQDRARDTVERIFQSMRAIMLRAGASALTVPRLAQDAGITPPTFYRYFGDVTEVMRAGMLRFALRRVQEWIAVIDAHHFTSDANLADMVTSLGSRNYLRISGLPPDVAAALMPHFDPVARQAARHLAPAILRAMARCDLEGSGTITEDVMTSLLAGMLTAASVMALADIEQLRSEQTRRFAAGMFLGGLRAWYSPSDTKRP